MSGKDYLVYLSSDRTAIGDDTLVEDQGDLQINPGKSLNTTAYKDTSKTAQGNDGWSATFTCGAREPLGTGQALLLDAMDNGGTQHVTIKSAVTGAVTWEGPIKLTVTTIDHPTSGETAYSVEMREDGVITRGTAA